MAIGCVQPLSSDFPTVVVGRWGQLAVPARKGGAAGETPDGQHSRLIRA